LIADSVAGDGIYSNTFSIQEPASGDYYYAAKIEGSDVPATLVHVTAVAAPTMQRLGDLQGSITGLSDQLAAAVTGSTPDAQALEAVRQAVLAQPALFDPTSIEVTDSGIAWTSTEGIGSVLLLADTKAQVRAGSSSA